MPKKPKTARLCRTGMSLDDTSWKWIRWQSLPCDFGLPNAGADTICTMGQLSVLHDACQHGASWQGFPNVKHVCSHMFAECGKLGRMLKLKRIPSKVAAYTMELTEDHRHVAQGRSKLNLFLCCCSGQKNPTADGLRPWNELSTAGLTRRCVRLTLTATLCWACVASIADRPWFLRPKSKAAFKYFMLVHVLFHGSVYMNLHLQMQIALFLISTAYTCTFLMRHFTLSMTIYIQYYVSAWPHRVSTEPVADRGKKTGVHNYDDARITCSLSQVIDEAESYKVTSGEKLDMKHFNSTHTFNTGWAQEIVSISLMRQVHLLPACQLVPVVVYWLKKVCSNLWLMGPGWDETNHFGQPDYTKICLEQKYLLTMLLWLWDIIFWGSGLLDWPCGLDFHWIPMAAFVSATTCDAFCRALVRTWWLAVTPGWHRGCWATSWSPMRPWMVGCWSATSAWCFERSGTRWSKLSGQLGDGELGTCSN